MSNPIWVRWYPKDAMDAMHVLTPMEELAYRRILDMIFSTNDRLPDHDGVLQEQTRLGKKWKAAKNRLIELGKIYVENGFIRNAKASKSVQDATHFVDQKRVAGKLSSIARNGIHKSLINKQNTSTDVDLPLQRKANEPGNESSTNQQSTTNKERERKNPPKPPDQTGLFVAGTEPCDFPDWLPRPEWTAFVEMRKKLRKPLTAHAEKLVIRKLDEFRKRGFSPAEALNNSVLNGWQGIFEPKPEQKSVRPKLVMGDFGEMVMETDREGFY